MSQSLLQGLYLCLLSLQEEFEDEDQWALKEGVWQSYGSQGGNVLKYKAKVNALSKLKNSCPSTTLALQPI
jgi:hypothetical protein